MAQNVDTSNLAKNKLEEKDILIISNVYRNSASAQAGPDNLQDEQINNSN